MPAEHPPGPPCYAATNNSTLPQQVLIQRIEAQRSTRNARICQGVMVYLIHEGYKGGLEDMLNPTAL